MFLLDARMAYNYITATSILDDVQIVMVLLHACVCASV